MKDTAKNNPSKKTNTESKSENEIYGIEESKLSALFVDQLKDIYWAEKELTTALTKMIENATSEELLEALEIHLDETKMQATKLEKVFSLIGENARGKKCDAILGLIKEAEGIMKDSDKGAMRDAGIISAAQKVEHYEIATYGTLRTYAEILGYEEAANILDEILEEERNADETLTDIAASINMIAASEPE